MILNHLPDLIESLKIHLTSAIQVALPLTDFEYLYLTMDETRVHRLLRLITLLQSGRAKTIPQLMDELSVSRRTLFRDLNTLTTAGIPCSRTPTKGYIIEGKFFLPPVNLTTTETLGLLLLSKISVVQRNQPLIGSAISAITKITATVPEATRSACNDLMTHISVNPGNQATSPLEREHFPTLQRCIDEARECQMVYRIPVPREEATHVLRPYALHYATRAWYVFGWSNRYDEVRVFKLSRIKQLEPMESLFERPRKFSVSEKLGSAWQLIPEGKIYPIELEFTAKVATNVTEVRWHSSQESILLPDGRCRVKFNIDGLGEIAWWICGYADQVQVIKPPELKAKVQSMLQHALANYEKK